jgi:hypothetical protein
MACTSQPEVRQDPEPLLRRVHLPQPARAVRWLVTPAYIESRWLEAPEKPMRIAAWLEMPHDLSNGAAVEFEVAADTAKRVLPQTISGLAVERDEFMHLRGANAEPAVHSINARTGVERAVWLPGGLWLELFVRDE